MCSGPLIHNWAWKIRFTQCVASLSLSQGGVCTERGGLPMCSGPFISLERGGLPSVQWALHPSWERRFIQCAVGPSSLLREEVYLVCSGPFIPLERRGLSSVQWAHHPTWPCKMRFTQCAASPSSILRMRFGQCAVGPSSITRLKDVSSPSVWRALHSPRVKFTQCAAEPLIPKRWDYQIFPILTF